MRNALRILLAVVAAPSSLWAQGLLPPELAPGSHGVGSRALDTIDASRSFPRGEAAVPRPMRVYLWYPARPRTGAPMALAELIRESMRGGSAIDSDAGRAFARRMVRARSGPAFADMTDASVDALLRAPLLARRAAAELAGRFPVILLSPASPATMPATAELLASNGFLVVGVDRMAAHSVESLEFTPNPASIEAETRDLEFALAFARNRRGADATRVGVLGYSSSGVANLAFTFRSRLPRAVAVFEGWEGTEMGQGTVRSLPDFEPRAFRAAYLLIEKADAEPIPGGAKSSAFLDSIAQSRRWRVRFAGATHTDFASLAVARSPVESSLRRNFSAANRMVVDFFRVHVAGDPARLKSWPPVSAAGVEVAGFDAAPRTPSRDEFFHLAERDAVAADSVAIALSARTPPVVPFGESSLNRLALLVGRTQSDVAARLYRMVARAYPRSVTARVGLADALAQAARADEARAATRDALRVIEADSSLSAEQQAAMRSRLMQRLAPGS